MSGWILNALLIGVTAWVAWSLAQARFVFQIRIRDGQPVVRKGKVSLTFLGHIAEVCRDGGVTQGWVGGVQRGRWVMLQFSRNFPPGVRQRVRNAWGMSR
jgi:hypothetical protein